MIEIFKKRGKWCYRDNTGRLHKFSTELAAKSSLGLETTVNGSSEKKDHDKEESYKESSFQAPYSSSAFRVSEEDPESESEEE